MEKSIHVLARAVIIKNAKLLVCISPTGAYYLPGGHVELGESAAMAVEREMREELGSIGIVQRFLGCLETEEVQATAHGCHHLHKCHGHEYKFVFLVDVPELSTATVPQSPEEGTVFAWIPLAELQESSFQPHTLGNVLPEWLKIEQGSALVNSKDVGCKEFKSEGKVWRNRFTYLRGQ